MDAMHDSSARDPPPKCHPETRLKIVKFFLDWIKTQRSSTLVYWIHSPFGHGKSALMQTIMDHLVEDNQHELFAGGFFFGRDKAGRDNISYLFITIAFQIASNVPGMREHIITAMNADPTLPSKSAEIQLRSLIIDPFFECADGRHFKHPPTVLIDGLDECGSLPSQIKILDLIASALQDHHVPLRFIIASRPESHIRNCFEKSPLKDISEEVQLPDNDSEMTFYVKTRFEEIYACHASVMRIAGVDTPWPPEAVIDELVRRASGQYVFVDTVLRFIGAYRFNPVSQLDIVLRRLSDESVFTDMDLIYHLILEQCPAVYRHILKIVVDSVMLHHIYRVRDPAIIADLWQLPEADVHIVVQTLAAVLNENSIHELSFHHVSFKEFLEAECRSGTFFCNDLLAKERMDARFKDVFKQVLCGELILKQSKSLGVYPYLEERPLDWFLPSELMGFLQQGQPQVNRTDKLFQWYFMVNRIATDTGYFLRGDDWEAISERGAIMELNDWCVGIWKSIANREFALMDPRLVKTLLDNYSHGNTLSEIASVARMTQKNCLRQLNAHKVLFVDFEHEDVDPSRVGLRDSLCILFNSDGTYKYVEEHRRLFYGSVG